MKYSLFNQVCLPSVCLIFFLTAGPVFGQKITRILPNETRVIVEMPNSTLRSTTMSRLWMLSYDYRPDAMQLMIDPRFRQSVELSEDQEKVLDEVQQTILKKQREIAANCESKLKDVTTMKEKLEVVNEHLNEFKEFQSETEEKLRKELIPLQSNLIDRYRFQRIVKTRGLGQTVISVEFKETFKVKPSQKKEIDRINQEMQEKMRKQIEKIKKEADKEVRKILDQEQIRSIKKLEVPFSK